MVARDVNEGDKNNLPSKREGWLIKKKQRQKNKIIRRDLVFMRAMESHGRDGVAPTPRWRSACIFSSLKNPHCELGVVLEGRG
jgi:hypothetical protein